MVEALLRPVFETQRYQRGFGRNNAVAELFGQFVAERCGTDCRYRQPTGGDYQMAAVKNALIRADFKACALHRIRRQLADSGNGAAGMPAHIA